MSIKLLGKRKRENISIDDCHVLNQCFDYLDFTTEILKFRRVSILWKYTIDNISNPVALNFSPFCSNVTNDVVEKTLIKFGSSHIQDLNFKGCKNITNSSLTNLSLQCPSLRHINFSGAFKVKDAVLLELGKNISSIESLVLVSEEDSHNTSSVPSYSTSSYFPKWMNLHTLKLNGCLRFSEKRLMKDLPLCKNLTCLELSKLHVSGRLLRAISKTLDKLKELNLSLCTSISAVDIDQLHLSLPHLEKLNVSGCFISGGTMQVDCPSLKVLNLNRCKVKFIRAQYQNLNELYCSWTVIENLNDFLLSLSNLKVVDLSGTKVSTITVESMLKSCNYLQYLDLSSCRNVDRRMRRNPLQSHNNNNNMNINSNNNNSFVDSLGSNFRLTSRLLDIMTAETGVRDTVRTNNITSVAVNDLNEYGYDSDFKDTSI